jgi:two-component system CheB/CheR fusion protein
VTSALRDDAGKLLGFVKIARDRTDLRAQIESLQHRLEGAQGAEHHRQVVLGTLAHELRNPLGEIANAARLVRRIAAEDETIRNSVQVIERQVRFIDNLVRDLLESTRLAVGKARLHCEVVDLRKLIDDAVETIRGALEAREQPLEIVAPAETPVEVDAVRMRQVLVNLVGNASKFSPFGSRIWIKANVEASELVVRVEDRGRGIPAEMLPRIFELFTQTGPEGGRAGHGLGLGLGVVKSLVEMHGGTVQARSEGSGRGTEIIVRVPARRPRGEGS